MKKINLIFGFFISWPLYIDLQTLQFIIHSSNEQPYYGSEGGLPLPIGIFSFLFIFFLIKKKYYLKSVVKGLPGFAILIVILFDVGFFAYVFAIIFVLLNLLLREKNRIVRNFRGLTSGWLIGGSVQLVFFFIYNYGYLSDNWKKTPNIFDIQIYSFLVSYSAVMSLLFACIMVKILKSGFPQILFLLGPFSFFPVYVAMRKAALIDLLSGIIFNIFRFMSGGGKINIKMVYAFLFLCITFILFYNHIGAARDVSVSGSWVQRSGPYITFAITLFELSSFEFLFGYKTGFGGNSNIILDVFTRSGLLGVVAIIVSIAIPFVKIFMAAWAKAGLLDKLLIVMLLNNLVVGNLVNLNLTQPYFVINFLVATLLVLESSKEKINANSHL